MIEIMKNLGAIIIILAILILLAMFAAYYNVPLEMIIVAGAAGAG